MDVGNQYRYKLLPKKTLGKEIKLRIIIMSTYVLYNMDILKVSLMRF